MARVQLPIQRFHDVFDPMEALPYNDPRYVDCSAVRGSARLLSQMANEIRRSPSKTSQTLSGHRGCGKTTELFRLIRDLEQGTPPYFVVYCESDKYVDTNDVEYIDVLLAVVQELWTQADAKGTPLRPGILKEFWSGIWSILTSLVEPKETEFGVGLGKLVFEIKKNPEHRRGIREYLRPRSTDFLNAVNEVFQRAHKALEAQGYGGIVVVVDNLDRIFRNVDPETKRVNLDALFIDASEYLRGVEAHTIYTVPPSLLYSPSGPKLYGRYGSQCKMLPMIPTFTRNGAPDGAGRGKLEEAVLKRLEHVHLTVDEAFESKETLLRFCLASGGFVRLMCALARTASANVSALPIKGEILEFAIKDTRDGYIRAVRDLKQWNHLRQVREGRSINEGADYVELLDNHTIFEYRDVDGPWWDVNPIVQEATQFRAP